MKFVRMKRSLWCLIGFLLFFPPSAATAKSPVTLNVWAMGAEGKKIREMADRFEAMHPDLRIVTQAIPWSGAHEKIMTSVIGEIPPDVCQMGTTWMAEFATIGALEPLDAFLSQTTDISVGQFFPGALETNRVNGQLFGVPWYVDTRILFYRADLLKQAGFPKPPETWDELQAAARALKKVDADGRPIQYGMAMAPNDWGEFLPLFWQNDGQLLNDDMTAAGVDRAPFVEAASYFKYYFDTEELTPLYQGAGMDLLQGFKTGYFPMFIGGPWMVAEVKNKIPDVRDSFAVTPRPGRKNRKSFIGGCNLVTFRKSKNKEWALKFIAYLSRPDIQVEWYKMTTDLPAARDAWNADILKNDPHLNAFGRQLAWTQAPPNHPSWEQMASAINRVLEKIVRNKISVEEGYGEMVRDLDQILKPTAGTQSNTFKLAVCGGLVLLMMALLLAYFYMGKTEKGQWSPTHPVQAVPFLFPALLLLSVFLLIPIMASLVMSLTNWDIYSLANLDNLTILGLDNYKRLLTSDAVFQKSVFNTFIFVVVAVPMTIAVALGMALVVNSAVLNFKAFFRTGFFIPVITTMVAVAVIWRWLYNPQFGLINLALEKMGLEPQNWLGDERLALPSLILMAIWKNFGYNMVIFIAGLQAIPAVLYEAADIDGVNAWQRFRNITLPMLKPSMIFVCITTVIGYFQFFAEPYIMTEGGPNNATNSIVLYTYTHAFKFYNMGYASAISYLLFMMTLVFSLAQIAYARKTEQ